MASIRVFIEAATMSSSTAACRLTPGQSSRM
jgi:hypothetical protein